MSRERGGNLLGLAILSLLQEKPMHPYEIATVMKDRGMEYSIKLNYGSLYSTIAGLLVDGKVGVHATEREGNLPERTVYHITEAGVANLLASLAELLRVPQKEYPRLTAGLTFLGHLPPVKVRELLLQRLETLRETCEGEKKTLRETLERGVDELFVVEMDYTQAMLQAEIGWIQGFLARYDRLTRESSNGLIWHLPSVEPYQGESL